MVQVLILSGLILLLWLIFQSCNQLAVITSHWVRCVYQYICFVVRLQKAWVYLVEDLCVVLLDAAIIEQTLRWLTNTTNLVVMFCNSPSLDKLRLAARLSAFGSTIGSCSFASSPLLVSRSHQWPEKMVLGKFLLIQRGFTRLADITHCIGSSTLLLSVSILWKNACLPNKSLIVHGINYQRAMIDSFAGELLA